MPDNRVLAPVNFNLLPHRIQAREEIINNIITDKGDRAPMLVVVCGHEVTPFDILLDNPGKIGRRPHDIHIIEVLAPALDRPRSV